jgi:hypothetical protein
MLGCGTNNIDPVCYSTRRLVNLMFCEVFSSNLDAYCNQLVTATKGIYPHYKRLLFRRHENIRCRHKSNNRSCNIYIVGIRIIPCLPMALEARQETLLVKYVQQWVSSNTSHFKS